MAEGFLKSFDSKLKVVSAGTEQSSKVHPKAIQVMKELGIDISKNHLKFVNEFLDKRFDYVITVCGGANESCLAFMGKVKHRIHIGFDDPSYAEMTEEFIWSEFQRVRDEIKLAFLKFYNENIK